MPEDPLQLAHLAAAGDARALETLLEQNLPAVRAFVRAHMGPQLRARESASDLVQSVCRELLTHQQRFQHPSADAFQAWLFTTARRKVHNRARDLGRHKRAAEREQGPLDESALVELGGIAGLDGGQREASHWRLGAGVTLARLERDAALAASPPAPVQGELGPAYARVTGPADRALRAEEVARLEAAIDRLPDEQREAITLVHLAGLPHADVAERLDKTDGALRQLLYRAKARLAVLLDDDGDAP